MESPGTLALAHVRDSDYAGMGTRVDGMSGSHITPPGCTCSTVAGNQLACQDCDSPHANRLVVADVASERPLE